MTNSENIIYGSRNFGKTYTEMKRLVKENDKLKAEVEQLKQNIIDGANDTYSLQKLDHELLTKEIEQLKEENEQLKISDESKEQSSINYYNLYRQALNEVKQLKSELEQSVKLPCRVGDVVYECDKDVKEIKCYKIKKMQSVTIELDFIGDIFTRRKLVSCGSEHIGNLIFLTREEAEQHLKGKVQK